MKDIPGYEGRYAVTEDGRVWSYPKIGRGKGTVGGWLKQGKHYKGYVQHYLCRDNIKKTIFTHRLVALTYIPNPLGRKELNHKNGIKSDNRVENLEWSDRSDNLKHAVENGLLAVKRGAKHNMAKLTESQVLEIRNLWESRPRPQQRDIGKLYGVTQSAIHIIVSRKGWKHI